MYSYEEAILIDDLTREEVVREILSHQSEPNDFFNEVGKKKLYTGEEVLNWLGY